MQLLRILNPIEHARTAEGVARYRVEPYVVAGDIVSTAPHVGRGGWTWYTGSAAWAYRAGVEAVLGLKLLRGRLVIDPCISASWPGFRATLRIGGGTIEVDVENPHGVSVGVAEMVVDGITVDGNSVELPAAGRSRSVRVRLGVEGKLSELERSSRRMRQNVVPSG
jgi:cyclic beta-1,2-glucan synthetase